MQLRNTLELILYKSYTDIKAEAARSYLGLLWWIIEPVLYLCAFYILFVLVMHRGDKDFVPTFLCGAVVWKWFASGIQGGGACHQHPSRFVAASLRSEIYLSSNRGAG